ncbi:MAG: hypothetical protein M3Q52_08615, partial [Pseudomonadota bacterium]|nr:hypothetical protein [Pseudomonadota bacterium]
IRDGRYHDPTCEIGAGVHEFITSPSFAHYGTARIELGERLTRLARSGVFIEKGPMTEMVVQAIAAGIEQSAHTPNFVLKFFRAFLGR